MAASKHMKQYQHASAIHNQLVLAMDMSLKLSPYPGFVTLLAYDDVCQFLYFELLFHKRFECNQ